MSDYHFAEAFGEGEKAANDYMSLAERIAARRSEDQLKNRSVDAEQGKIDFESMEKTGMTPDQMAAGRAAQEAKIAGVPSDMISPTGQQYGSQLEQLGTELAKGRSAKTRDIESQAALRESLAGKADRWVPGGGGSGSAKDPVLGALTNRMAQLDKLRQYGGDVFTPELEAEYQGLQTEINKRTGAKPVAVEPVDHSVFGWLKRAMLPSAGAPAAAAPAASSADWKKYVK